MPEPRSLPMLAAWLSAPQVDAFPHDAVVDDFQRVGKHFVAGELLEALHRIRLRLPEIPGGPDARKRLGRFLDIALDKRDERYDYRSYLALGLLPLPEATECRGAVAVSADGPLAQHDRLFTQLIADIARFELDILAGSCDLLPRMRPDSRTVTKRLRLAARVAQPALRRLGLAEEPDLGTGPALDATEVAGHLSQAVLARASGAERQVLRLSMLPVWIAHDEYMFIRVLQAFETTFALLAVQLRATVGALAARRPAVAVAGVNAATGCLSETARAFSLMATMQIASFVTFRQYTEGASAIQSRSYKIVEALCSHPAAARLNSSAYYSVPEVRDQVLAGQPNLDDLLDRAASSGWLTAAARAEITAAMRRFEATLLHWRQTHYRLAVRMLGDRSGTGYTEGTPYLHKVRENPVFSRRDPA